jgi:hypothetical protein
VKRKKWAEARREEEEDFNLSPWFVLKPLPALFFSFLSAPKMYQVIPNNIYYINSPNKYNRKNDRQKKFFCAAITNGTGKEFPYNRLIQNLTSYQPRP